MKITVEELKQVIEKIPPFETELPAPRIAFYLPDNLVVSKFDEPLGVIQYR